MKSGRIRNRYITSSSRWDRYHAAWLARLNSRRRGRNVGAWSAKTNNRQQWLQVDLRVPTLVTGVATQGRQDYAQWVTSYGIAYSLDGAHFAIYKQKGRSKVRGAAQLNAFSQPSQNLAGVGSLSRLLEIFDCPLSKGANCISLTAHYSNPTDGLSSMQHSDWLSCY